MAKRRYDITEQRIARWQREGRGRGRGSEYRPWITIHDVSSFGLSSRPPGVKTGRIHHLLSNNEAAVFYEAEWSTAVSDIREQFPLCRSATRAIAEEMGVKHPSQHGVDIVMTTDFLLDVVGQDTWLSFALPPGSGKRLLAVAVKPDSVHNEPRILEKLEIERRYWSRQGVGWTLVRSGDLCRIRTKKLQWLLEWYWLDHMTASDRREFRTGCRTVFASLQQAEPDRRAGDFLSFLDTHYGWVRGTALSMIRHLAAHKQILVSTDIPYDNWGPLAQLSANETSIRAIST